MIRESLYLSPGLQDQGVFSKIPIRPQEIILEFTGKILKSEELPPISSSSEDRYLQIDRDTYMGPSGSFDDYINHSCDPNTGLIFRSGHIFLVALRDIPSGEEITWDYSTTMDEDDWEIPCICRSSLCRGRIGDFKYLPLERKLYYAKLGVVPSYNLRYIPSSEKVAYRPFTKEA